MAARSTSFAPCPSPTTPASSMPLRTARRPELHAGLVGLVPELRARALRLCGDSATAADLAQDAVERALRFESQYEAGTNLRAWVFQILYSVFVTRWRRRRRESLALEQLAADPHAWTRPRCFGAPDVGQGALAASTRRKIEALPEGFRAAVVLVDLEQCSYRDAARALGVPVGTVMSRLHRARKILAAQMAGEREAA